MGGREAEDNRLAGMTCRLKRLKEIACLTGQQEKLQPAEPKSLSKAKQTFILHRVSLIIGREEGDRGQ